MLLSEELFLWLFFKASLGIMTRIVLSGMLFEECVNAVL